MVTLSSVGRGPPAWTIMDRSSLPVSSSAWAVASPVFGSQSHCCHLPPTTFGNGRTHTGEVMGSGGSRLANYGARAQLAALHAVAAGGPTPQWARCPAERGNRAGSLTTRQWRGWVQPEVALNVSLHPPEVTGLRVSWEAVLQPRGAAKRAQGPA